MANEYDITGYDGMEFFPFDDARERKKYIISAILEQSGSGYDTSTIDPFRQGVEITNQKYLYLGNQPKIWAGNINHFGNVVTFGQLRSWTEYTNTKAHDDTLVVFDPVQYITNSEQYPSPVYLNEGPQTNEEASMEPLGIPYKKTPAEGNFLTHTIKAYLDEGNYAIDDFESQDVAKQFINYEDPITPRFFLDEGGYWFANSIRIDNNVPYIERVLQPFNDTKDEELIKQLEVPISDTDFLESLKLLSLELDEDIRQTFEQKSATAGYSVYGPEQAIYGTDSISYNGWLRGS